ncbi:hypothetical protein E4K10_30555 [Streptomyces sp. T1317-0309]|nr:hypothetical protein E4K10_30555 [Streptomyces sp. T1317-0309]
MAHFLVPLAVAAAIVGISTAVLVRRDRRRMAAGPETLYIEESATPGTGETRRRVRMYQQRFLRERE